MFFTEPQPSYHFLMSTGRTTAESYSRFAVQIKSTYQHFQIISGSPHGVHSIDDTLYVQPTDTIADIKSRIAEESMPKFPILFLINKSTGFPQILEDDQTCATYDIKPDSTLFLHPDRDPERKSKGPIISSNCLYSLNISAPRSSEPPLLLSGYVRNCIELTRFPECVQDIIIQFYGFLKWTQMKATKRELDGSSVVFDMKITSQHMVEHNVPSPQFLCSVQACEDGVYLRIHSNPE